MTSLGSSARLLCLGLVLSCAGVGPSAAPDRSSYLESFGDRYRTIPSTTPDRYREVRVERGVKIAMRDGVELNANLFLPAAPGPFPVILIRTPYGIEQEYTYMPAIGRFWARKGYALVSQDTRGKYASEGVYRPVKDEVDDGYDTLAWIAAQPWCNGRIGMTGDSYYGLTAWAGAISRHPNLRAVAPSTIALDLYRVAYRNGAYALPSFGQWILGMESHTYQDDSQVDYESLPLRDVGRRAGLADAHFRRSLASWRRDAYWDLELGLHARRSEIAVPALHMGGWYDVFLVGTLDDWRVIREQAAPEVRAQQWLSIGPWDHEWTPESTNRVGRRTVTTELGSARWDTLQAFFDRYLLEIDNGWQRRPSVEIFTLGDDRWRFEKSWPPLGIEYTDFFLHPARGSSRIGSLDTEPPVRESTASYLYDPADPVVLEPVTPGVLFAWERAARLVDRRRLLSRSDVLVYDSEPLESALEITGPIEVTLYASSSAVDTDFTAALVEVHADGYAELVQEGIQRASFRESERNPTPIEPGRSYAYTIDLWATSRVVAAGHRLRVEISSSNHSAYYRNDNSGNWFAASREIVRAEQTIHHGPRRASHIRLPLRRRR